MEHYALLRFSGSHLHDPAIAAWFDAKPAAIAALVRPWWTQLRARGLDVSEGIHDGCPVVCIALEALILAAFEDIQHRLAHEDRIPQKARTKAANTPGCAT